MNIGFDAGQIFRYLMVVGLLMFGADMNISVHIDKRENIFNFRWKPNVKVLHNTALTTEREYSINFSDQHKKFCLLLHDNGVNSYIFFMVSKYLN